MPLAKPPSLRNEANKSFVINARRVAFWATPRSERQPGETLSGADMSAGAKIDRLTPLPRRSAVYFYSALDSCRQRLAHRKLLNTRTGNRRLKLKEGKHPLGRSSRKRCHRIFVHGLETFGRSGNCGLSAGAQFIGRNLFHFFKKIFLHILSESQQG